MAKQLATMQPCSANQPTPLPSWNCKENETMNDSRRSFVAAGAAALAFAPVAAAWGEEKQGDAAKVDGLTCLDYGRSFICNTASFNAVCFWVESRTVLVDG